MLGGVDGLTPEVSGTSLFCKVYRAFFEKVWQELNARLTNDASPWQSVLEQWKERVRLGCVGETGEVSRRWRISGK